VVDRRFVPGGGPAEQLTALGRDCERTSRRLGALEDMLADLAADVAALGDRLDQADAAVDPMRSWLAEGGPAGAAELLADLVDWVGRVYLRYPGAGGAQAWLPSCWLWHPWAVEELLWLRHAHHAAYDGPRAAWAKAADWHERMRPGVAARLAAALGGCELALHQNGREQHAAAPAVPLGDAAAVIARWATGGLGAAAAPEPTAEQLAQADRHSRTHHRRHP
jgi:hypothetical protein